MRLLTSDGLDTDLRFSVFLYDPSVAVLLASISVTALLYDVLKLLIGVYRRYYSRPLNLTAEVCGLAPDIYCEDSDFFSN